VSGQVSGQVSDSQAGPAVGDRRGSGAALATYLASATLVRSASGGAAVGLVSLAITGGRGGTVVGGVLAALLTAPNLAGPWVAKWMEKAKDSRLPLGGGFITYGVVLAGCALLLGRLPIVLVAVLISVAGLCDPLMTGGLSSRLVFIVGSDPLTQRRAEAWDSATYGIGNIAGPAAVAGLVVVLGPVAAVVALGASAVLAGLLLFLLPGDRATPAGAHDPMAVRDALKVVVGRGPLRRVMVATMLTSISTGGVMVIAVVFGNQLHHAAGAGAVLGATYGIGNLCGALSVGVFPMRGEPERLTLRLIAVNAVAIALCAVVPNYPLAMAAFALAGASSSILFTATLAVRSQYSPPNARAHVFVIMAGFKMATASAGTALAGTLVGIGPRPLLLLGALITATAVGVAALDRHLVPARLFDEPIEQQSGSLLP
jgi:hypothetical protein